MAQRISHALAPQSHCVEKGAEAQEAGTPSPRSQVTWSIRAESRAQGGPCLATWPSSIHETRSGHGQPEQCQKMRSRCSGLGSRGQ